MLTDDELKEIRARHKHEWDDGFENIPLLIDEIEMKNLEAVLRRQSLRAYAEKVESLNAVIETLTDKLTAAGITVDVRQAEIEGLREALGDAIQLISEHRVLGAHATRVGAIIARADKFGGVR